jgi:uncharacterized membrane protein
LGDITVPLSVFSANNLKTQNLSKKIYIIKILNKKIPKINTMSAVTDFDWLLLPKTLAQVMIATAAITFISLLVGPTAPYGRYVSTQNNYSDLYYEVFSNGNSALFRVSLNS